MSTPTLPLAGRVALVTGGARRVGAAIVEQLHGAGASVVIHYGRSAGPARELAERLEASRPGSTALLAADELLELHALLRASIDRLSDQSHKPLLHSLEDRLIRAGLLDDQGVASRFRHPKRALAHRSFVEEKRGTLADAEAAARVERAIRDRRRVWLRHLPDPVTDEQRRRGDDGRFRA